MELRGSADRYGAVARFLHWSVAALFAVQYVAIYYRHWFTMEDTPASNAALQLHLALGISVLVFSVPRVAWSWFDNRPALIPERRWERLGARLVHGTLYFFMIAMPISGYLYSSNGIHALGIPRFADTALSHWLTQAWGLRLNDDIRTPMRIFHRELAGELLLWILIAVHAGAACYHHYVRRDATLLRMLPRPAPSTAAAEAPCEAVR